MEFDLFEEFESDGVAEVSCVMGGEVECRGRIEERGYGAGTLVLCEAHMYVLASWRNRQTAEEVSKIYESGLATEHSEGLTYSIEMANGNAKTGMTTSQGELGRLVSLSRKENGGVPVKVLALFEGGRTRELLAHHQWRDIRVPDQMEQFQLTPEYRAWAEGQGIPEKYREMVKEYEATIGEKMKRTAGRMNGGYVIVGLLSNGDVVTGHTTGTTINPLRDLSRKKNGGDPIKVLTVTNGGTDFRKDLLRKWKHLSSGTYGVLKPDPSLMEYVNGLERAEHLDSIMGGYEAWATQKVRSKVDLFEED